jgi:hypothetical protein
VKYLVRVSVLLLVLLGGAALLLHMAGGGFFGTPVSGGEPTARALPSAEVADRGQRQAAVAAELDVFEPKQILFGDLHVHSSFSVDAFLLTLPTGGGTGRHPVADACDFARFCAQLDFFSMNDHAASLSQRRWRETVEAVRQCNETGVGGGDPDLVSFLGWEWTQMGSTPDNHYGHKNVVLRDLEDEAIPARPIAAAPPEGVPSAFDAGRGGRLAMGLGAFALPGGHDMMRVLDEIGGMERCPPGVPVRDLPLDCSEAVATPAELFAKLDEWGHTSTVIPHGTVWGMYTPPGSSWAKQLDAEQHDPQRQRLVEVYSGHGNAEEWRPWVAAAIAADGSRSCPAPGEGYMPSCWRAGEIIRERCLAAGETEAECETRAGDARQNFVDADRNAGAWTVPGLLPHELGDAGQCLDCFQPAFNYRPRSSAQYMLALGRPEQAPGAQDFRFGFIASSDNHTARPGTGYKEVARRHMTDARMGEVGRTDITLAHRRPVAPRSERFRPEDRVPSVGFLEAERSGSFYLSGGLAAVHARSRDRNEIWDALERRETYGTSGPRILLWFDLLDPNAPRGAWPMGSEVSIAGAPTFRVRAAGSFEQEPGCPQPVSDALTPERIASLCLGECYAPSDRRRPITRIEVVRIRSQRGPEEAIGPLIEDPWKTLPCPADGSGCQALFSDPEFGVAGRATRYYVRAIEAASPVIAADPLGCERDTEGRCVELDPCFERPDDDDCTAPSEQRAWSSPIFVDPRSAD